MGTLIPAYYCEERGEMVVGKIHAGKMPEMRLYPLKAGRGYPGYLVLLPSGPFLQVLN